MRYNENAPGGAGNTIRGLTHSLDLTKEGLMPDRTRCLTCGAPNPPKAQPGGHARKFCSRLCRTRHHKGYTGVSTMTLEQRLWARVERGAPDECWPFRKAPTHEYGQLMDNRRPVLAHRLAYSLTKGEIPEGMVVRHTCDNPPCCNPAHLTIGTYADNSRDMTERSRAARLFQISTTKLTDEQVRQIVRRRRAGEGSADLASEFGVSRGYINDLAAGRAYRAIFREATA